MPKVTQEHVEARRRQILSAALRAFARQGFHRTTMQDIFREAGLSPGAVYSYFTGKDELIAAIIGEMMGFIGETAALFSEPLPDGRLRRPGEALVEMIERYQALELGTVEERARIFPHLVGEQQRNPQLTRPSARASSASAPASKPSPAPPKSAAISTRRSSPNTSPGSASHSCKARCSRSASTGTSSTSTATPAPRPR